LARTEAVTLVSETHVPAETYESARTHVSDEELLNLTVASNGWNWLEITF